MTQCDCLLVLASFMGTPSVDTVEVWMQQAFYPALLGILVIASLGIPIPEDIPLIAAGVILRTHPEVASWTGTMVVALMGIMSGDLVLYTMGRWWGPGVVGHRFVRWFVTPRRFVRVRQQFARYGAWYCFFGRFFMGIRAMMCIAAGATRFPYWRFFLADFAGALLSVPLFIGLGYVFAGMIPTLRTYMTGAQGIVIGALVVAAIVGIVWYRRRRRPNATPEALAAPLIKPDLPGPKLGGDAEPGESDVA